MSTEEELALVGAAFEAAAKIWAAVRDAKDGKITAADAMAGIDAVHNALAANNAAADAALAAKFKSEP